MAESPAMKIGDYPLEAVVQKYIRLVLTTDVSKAFSNEDEYIANIEAVMYLDFLLYDAQSALAFKLASGGGGRGSSSSAVSGLSSTETGSIQSSMGSLRDRLKGMLDSRLKLSRESGAFVPRMERLFDMLELSEKERVAFQYVVLNNVGVHFPAPLSRAGELRGMMREMSIAAGMSPREVLNFLNPTRRHMIDGYFESSDDSYIFEFAGLSLKMTKDVLSALMGGTLSAEQFINVENTLLGELLKKEGVKPESLIKQSSIESRIHAGGSVTAAMKRIRKQQKSMDEDQQSDDIDDDSLIDDMAGDVSDILNALRAEEKPPPSDDPSLLSSSKSKMTATDSAIDPSGDIEMTSSSLGDGSGSSSSSSSSSTAVSSVAPPASATGTGGSGEITAYSNDLEYLSDHFDLIEARIKLLNSTIEEKNSYVFSAKTKKTSLREYQALEKQALRKVKHRMQLTLERAESTTTSEPWIPRLERLCAARKLCEFEKMVLVTLTGAVLSIKVMKALSDRGSYSVTETLKVGDLLAYHFKELKDQVSHRRYFYKSGALVKDNLVRVEQPRYVKASDLMVCDVSIDRRMIDFIVGLDTEIGALVEGSHLLSPTVKLSDVILSEEKKKRILDCINGHRELVKARKELGLNLDVSSSSSSNPSSSDSPKSTSNEGTSDSDYYGNGTTLLFHGLSGTGKTMMAMALGNYLERKVLLVNLGWLSVDKLEPVMTAIFREAKLEDALVFFDECETLFENRNRKGGVAVNMALNLIERYSGLILLATNRSYELDEAMARRIALSVEFRPPTVHERKLIWKTHIPNVDESKKSMFVLHESVDFDELSVRFELTGGFIKNSMQSAVKMAALRRRRLIDGEGGSELEEQKMIGVKESESKEESGVTTKSDDIPIELRQSDLVAACKEQIIGQLELKGFKDRLVPNKGLDSLVLTPKVRKLVENVGKHNQARQVLVNWGFEEKALCVLIAGLHGVGKSSLAEVIAYECGRPMKVVTCAELLSVTRSSKTTSQAGQASTETVFSAVNTGAVMVIEGAESMFGGSPWTGHNALIAMILRQIRQSKGVFVFLIEGEVHSGKVIAMNPSQKSLFREFSFVISLDKPNSSMRRKMWEKLIPEKVSVDGEIDYNKLASKHGRFVVGDIAKVIENACARACLRPLESDRQLTMDDLSTMAQAYEDELETHGLMSRDIPMYS